MGRLQNIYQNNEQIVIQIRSIDAACDALEGAIVLYFQNESYLGAYLIAKSVEEYFHHYIKAKNNEETYYRKFLNTLNNVDRKLNETLYKNIVNRLKHGSSGASETQLLEIPYGALEYILMVCTNALKENNEKYFYYSPYFSLLIMYYGLKFPDLNIPIDEETKKRIELIKNNNSNLFSTNKAEFIKLFYNSAAKLCAGFNATL